MFVPFLSLSPALFILSFGFRLENKKIEASFMRDYEKCFGKHKIVGDKISSAYDNKPAY